MAYERLEYQDKGKHYIGFNADSKPTLGEDDVNSTLEELDTGAIYKWTGTEWKWYDTSKALDHNRAMMGLGLSYKTWHKVASVPDGQNAVYRFNPGAVNFHHAESRIWRAGGGDVDFEIWYGGNPDNLPAVVATLPKVNQKGLNPASQNSLLTFTYHGLVADAAMSALLTGATQVDFDDFLIASGIGNTTNTADSALPSGRHYDADTEYFIVQKPGNGDTIRYTYFYFWHEG